MTHDVVLHDVVVDVAGGLDELEGAAVGPGRAPREVRPRDLHLGGVGGWFGGGGGGEWCFVGGGVGKWDDISIIYLYLHTYL